MKYTFYSNCVNWPEHDVNNHGGLIDLIDARTSITYRTLRKHIGEQLDEFAEQLGYEKSTAKGLTMRNDWCVEFFKSKLHGKIVYGFRWSGIEYVFTAKK